MRLLFLLSPRLRAVVARFLNFDPEPFARPGQADDVASGDHSVTRGSWINFRPPIALPSPERFGNIRETMPSRQAAYF
jgi:hypothetical protein